MNGPTQTFAGGFKIVRAVVKQPPLCAALSAIHNIISRLATRGNA
jgi:hypothetical protein